MTQKHSYRSNLVISFQKEQKLINAKRYQIDEPQFYGSEIFLFVLKRKYLVTVLN